MNYIRGALQYYKDLPPINPATLTGAIDVIAIRKRLENGEYEIAASPFHVRFGKFQILRPGDKKVTISVNGKPIPFPMKIGEAGEAFFLFETNEEIEDELATSPLQSPLQSPRLGPTDASDENAEPSEATQKPTDEKAANDLSSEVEYLDLDADVEDSHKQSPPLSTKPEGFLERAKDIGKTIVKLTSETEKEMLEKIVDEKRLFLGEIDGLPTSSSTNIEPNEPTVEDSDVKNHKCITLHATGYHTQNNQQGLKQTLEAPQVMRALSTSNGTIDHPEVIVRSSSTGNEVVRGRSAPLELHTSSLPSSMEYEWDWGRFPQPSPMRERFQPKVQFTRISVSQPALVEEPSTSESLNSSTEVVFGLGGLLKPDPRDPSQFTLALDHTTISFQLSLCGRLDGQDEVEDSKRFERQRISWRRFMTLQQISKHDDLVILWDDKYVSRRDASPLFGALVHWRENTLSSQGYTSDGEPLSEGDELSEGEESKNLRVSTTRSTWSRWFGRRWSERQLPVESSKVDLRPSTPNRSQIQAAGSDLIGAGISASSVSPALDEKSASPAQTKRYAKALRLTSDQLKTLDLKTGPNQITFSLSATGAANCTARIFLWESTDHIVVSDIDGTITKSDALGHVFALVGRDWTHIGVAKLYTDICRNGYKIMYLTSRAIGQADSTRDYLKNINQNNQTLPEGPVIMSPDRLIASLRREVIMRKPEVFKMACLRDIVRLFGPTSRNPFYAGFGNRITDALSYRSVNIPSTRIFTIDSTGEVKTELLERAGYKSSYTHMSDLVDQQFPPIHRPWVTEYTDFNYWRPPLQQYDFPVLSNEPTPSGSRSESPSQGTLHRIRQFGLGRAASRSLFLPVEKSTKEPGDPEKQAIITNGHKASLSSSRSVDETSRRDRRFSGGSMPGSLPKSPGFFDDAFDEGEDSGSTADLEDLEEGLDQRGEEKHHWSEDGAHSIPDDELFFEDLLATGEMKNVPFL